MTDLISAMRAINKISRLLPAVFAFLYIVGAVWASTPDLATGLSNACVMARSALAVGAMLMVVLAAIVYALGQVMGAETRARATVWATAMLTGALIGILIYVLVPWIIKSIMGAQMNEGANPCAYSMV